MKDESFDGSCVCVCVYVWCVGLVLPELEKQE